jgi:predicted phosphodiesterase
MGFADELGKTRPPVFDPLSRQELIAALEAEGGRVTFDKPRDRVIPLSDQPEGTVRFAVISDTHLGHRHQQLTHLRDFYRRAAEWGAQFMLHAGDLVDGQNMHRDQQFELFRHGVDAQGKYAAEVLPYLERPLVPSKQVAPRSRKGVREPSNRGAAPQYIIGGNHDGSGWNDVGANVLGVLEAQRPDITFLGAPTATFIHGPLRIMLMHPDGGVAYARSYKLQKIVEGFEADAKPHVLLCGHWHTQCHVLTRNVHAFSLPCFQSQTPYMKRKGLQPAIGGYLFEIVYNKLGPVAVTGNLVNYPTLLAEDWP